MRARNDELATACLRKIRPILGARVASRAVPNHRIPIDKNGLRVDEFERKLEVFRAQAVGLMSIVQNPTEANVAKTKRKILGLRHFYIFMLLKTIIAAEFQTMRSNRSTQFATATIARSTYSSLSDML